MEEELARRGFLGLGVGLGATIAAGDLCRWSLQQAMAEPLERLAQNIPTVVLGRTKWRSKIIGWGRSSGPKASGQRRKAMLSSACWSRAAST